MGYLLGYLQYIFNTISSTYSGYLPPRYHPVYLPVYTQGNYLLGYLQEYILRLPQDNYLMGYLMGYLQYIFNTISSIYSGYLPPRYLSQYIPRVTTSQGTFRDTSSISPVYTSSMYSGYSPQRYIQDSRQDISSNLPSIYSG
jgi:hypothetical protein